MNAPNKLNGILSNSKVQILLILLLTVVVFIPALFAGFIWDDNAGTDNSLLRTVDGLWKIWFVPNANVKESHYWPVVYTFFWFENHLWGNNPFGYHLINILFHTLNVFLLWQILKRVGISGAGFIALLFALHPVHVESVAWIIELKDLLSAFFYLSSFLVYLTYQNNQNWKILLLSLVLFVCALLSKSIVASLPIAILFYLWWKKGKVMKNEVVSLLPFFFVAIMITFLDVKFAQHRSPAHLGLIPLERFIIAGKSLWFYFEKLILPTNLMTAYPLWDSNIYSIINYLYPVSYLLLLIMLYLGKSTFGRGPVSAFLYFAITLAPVLGFIEYGFMFFSYVADRFQYLASIGIIVLFGVLLINIYNRVKASIKPILRIVGITLLAILGFLTWKQTELYDNDVTLFQYNLIKNPNSWLAYNNLGVAMAQSNKPEEAIQYYSKAIKLKPEYSYPYNNLGILLLKEGHPKQAESYLRLAIQYNPVFVNAYVDLGIALALQGKYDEAIFSLKKALELSPFHAEAKYNLEKVYAEMQAKNLVNNEPQNSKSK